MLTMSARRGETWVPEVAPSQLRAWVRDPEALLWIDVVQPTEEELTLLADAFRFHPLAMEDVRNSHQRPKVDLYDEYLFLVFYSVEYDAVAEHVRLHEIELFVGASYVVTLHDAPLAPLNEAFDRWQHNVRHVSESMVSLLYSILDAVLDDYFPALDWYAERLDELEDEIFATFDPDCLKATLQMKRSLLALRRVVGPQRDVVNVLLRGESHVLPGEEALPYLQDLYDHTLRIVEGVDTYREMVTAVMEAFLSVQSNQINVVMQRLTIINLLFLPLAVLTGFFGMNFEALPFDDRRLLAVAMGAMVLLPISLYGYLHHKGWD